MSIVGSNPLAFLTSQGGVVGTPLSEAAAKGVDNLDVQQRSAVIGEPIPIVFGRRISGVGGVLVSAPATEARFEDDASSNITASYHLVLSEGQIDSIQVRDVFQGACRVGSFTQTYNRKAGTFVPGNYIDNTPNLSAPTYCGTSGTYAGLSTMSFSVTIPAGFDQWNRQVHCFVRGGMYVSRLLDALTGPSNNVADLLLYLMRNSSRVPDAMIDMASFYTAATFTDVNGFWFNGVVTESTNLRDWTGNTLQYFLLRQARIAGKESLKPLLPTNANGTIKITPVTWAFTFTEEHVIPDSFEIIYTPLADRKPFCATMLWRQQDDLGIPVMRTTEVRYTGTAIDGPFEQHDLSGFCSSENHAVKVGAYILAKRNHVTHRLQLGVRPDAFNPTLAAGDLVRVRLERNASTGASGLHDYIYEVERIGKSLAGEVRLDLTHFPVDANYASVVAQEVNAATGSGLTVGTGLSAITCDINSFSDTSVPAETFTTGIFPNYGSSFGSLSESDLGDPEVNNPVGSGSGGGGSIGGNNIAGGTAGVGLAQAGDTLSYDPGCPGAFIEWSLINNTTGEITIVGSGVGAGLTAVSQWEGNTIVATGRCPDSSSPTGYGPAITSSATVITPPWPLPTPLPSNLAGKITLTGTWSPSGYTLLWGTMEYRIRQEDNSCIDQYQTAIKTKETAQILGPVCFQMQELFIFPALNTTHPCGPGGSIGSCKIGVRDNGDFRPFPIGPIGGGSVVSSNQGISGEPFYIDSVKIYGEAFPGSLDATGFNFGEGWND